MLILCLSLQALSMSLSLSLSRLSLCLSLSLSPCSLYVSISVSLSPCYLYVSLSLYLSLSMLSLCLLPLLPPSSVFQSHGCSAVLRPPGGAIVRPLSSTPCGDYNQQCVHLFSWTVFKSGLEQLRFAFPECEVNNEVVVDLSLQGF